jgi:WhiB family redox-sensing transcriptional regulator
VSMEAAMSDWMTRGACRDQPNHVFFPPAGEHGGREAKRICATCPVKKECLEFAIDTRQEYGIWAGMTANERQAFEDKRPRKYHRAAGVMNAMKR